MADNAADKAAPLIELFRNPLLVVFICLGLWFGKSCLGIQYGTVEKISASGVEFGQVASGKLADLEGRLKGVEAEIDLLKKQPAGGAAATDAASNEARDTVFAAEQVVSDQTAQLAKLSAPAGGAPLKGFLWIGNWDETSHAWRRPQLLMVDTGQPPAVAPTALLAGTEFKTRGNSILRDGAPTNDTDYFRSRKSIGAVPAGTRVRLSGAPVSFNRGYALQYWAEIEVLGPDLAAH
jgi:hypothetical protein